MREFALIMHRTLALAPVPGGCYCRNVLPCEWYASTGFPFFACSLVSFFQQQCSNDIVHRARDQPAEHTNALKCILLAPLHANASFFTANIAPPDILGMEGAKVIDSFESYADRN
jgi:hypothetical protein